MICSGCKEDLDITLFNKKGYRKDGSVRYQSFCRECNKTASRKYYAENKEHHKKIIYELRKKQIQEKRSLMIQYFLEHPCTDCGMTDVRTLEFDHLHSKEVNISEVLQSWSWKRILQEIAKCDVVCANCHGIRTHSRANTYRQKAWLEMN